MKPMIISETASRAVGAEQDIVEEQAVNLIHDLAAGIPRIINTVTRASLENAAEQKTAVIQLEHVRDAQESVLPPEGEVKYA